MFTRTTPFAAAGIALTLLLAAPALAQETTSTTGAAATTQVTTTSAKPSLEQLIEMWKTKLAAKRASSTNALKNVDASCVQAAVQTRETALKSAWDKLSTAIGTALSARSTALYDAWGNEDLAARVAAIKAAMTSWKDAHKAAYKTLKEERNAAWKTFKDTARNECKVSVPIDEKLATDTSGAASL